MLETIRRIARCEQGATAVEYGLIAALIAVSSIVAFTNFANSTTGLWNTVSNRVVDASS